MSVMRLSVFVACLLLTSHLVHGADCPSRGNRGPRGFPGPAVIPFTMVIEAGAYTPYGVGPIQTIGGEAPSIYFVTGPSGTNIEFYDLEPANEAAIEFASRAVAAPFAGQVQDLVANVMYYTSGSFFNDTSLLGTAIGNVTFTVYVSPGGESDFTATSIVASTNYILGPTGGPLTDVVTSDETHQATVAIGDRLVVLATFVPFSSRFADDDEADSQFWISGSFVLA